MLDASWQALEWAMALAKTPAERRQLRQRSLPAGVERLLQVAAGTSGDTLLEFVEHTGESEADVLDAARFYAREILFYQGADAYRVLGVAHNADTDTIRSHHRLLQQWLHPDRHSSDWDAIFASRVNAAWSQLRSDERRQAYDHSNPPQQRDSVAVNAGSPVWLDPRVGLGSKNANPWGRRAPVLALFGVCGVLAVLAIRDMQKAPEGVLGDLSGVDSTQADPSRKQTNAAVTLHLPDAFTRRGRARSKSSVASVASAVTTAITKPAPTPRTVAAAARPSTPNVGATVLAKPIPTPTPALKPASKPAAPVAATKGASKSDAVAVATNLKPKLVADDAVRKSTSKLVAMTSPPGQKVVANKAEVAEAPISSEGKDASSPGKAPLVSQLRIQLAQQAGSSLINFMSRKGAVIPPIWGSLGAQQRAAQQRSELNEGGRPASIAPPDWRIGQSSAVMQAVVRYADGRSARISADFLWRENRWLVTRTTLEQNL